MKRTYGEGDDKYTERKKNAFRYPNHPEAVFPKHPEPVYIDRRAAHVPAELRVRGKTQKVSKLEEQRRKEEIEESLRKAEEKVEGENSGNIDLSKIDTYNMSIDNDIPKQKKKKTSISNDMMIDEVDNSNKKIKTVRYTNKQNQKKKAYIIVNNN